MGSCCIRSLGVFDQILKMYTHQNFHLRQSTFANNITYMIEYFENRMKIVQYVIDFWFVICYDHTSSPIYQLDKARKKNTFKWQNVSRDCVHFNSMGICKTFTLRIENKNKLKTVNALGDLLFNVSSKSRIVIWDIFSVRILLRSPQINRACVCMCATKWSHQQSIGFSILFTPIFAY